jgi:hypothetical protein
MPSQCELRYFTSAQARACLAGKWIAFIGDSTIEVLAISTALLIHGSFNELWAISPCTLPYQRARTFDTRTDLVNGVRIIMFWAAATTPCSDGTGVASFRADSFRLRLSRAHAKDMEGTRAPRIIANSGLHDIANQSTTWTAEYEVALTRTVLPLLSNLTRPHKLTWKTSNPKTARYACTSMRGVVPGEAAVEAMNAAAERAIATRPVATLPVTVLDQNAILLPLHETTYVSQHRCSSVLRAGFTGRAPDGSFDARLMFASGERTMGGVYSGCIATVHAMLSMICPPA